MISEGKEVSIEYRVYLLDGTEVDSNIGYEELTFIQGQHEILPALEEAIEGMHSGTRTQIKLSPEEAYGPIDDEYFHTIEINMIPEELRYKGAFLSVEDDSGEFYKARLNKINSNNAIIDFNHPLAGKSLIYEIEIKSVGENPKLN